MLLRPPFIQQEDVKSQTSNAVSQMQRQKSVKSNSKNKKKENTLGMRKNNMMGMPYNQSKNTQSHNYDSDNGSVHSVNSRKSKGKTKQSTIAIGKKQVFNPNQNSAYSIKNQNPKQQYEIFKLDSDDDNKSVGSHASRNSKKNTVKQNSLGRNRNPKVNVQLNYYYNQKNQQDSSPRNYYQEEESKVQIVKLNQNTETFTQPIKYNQAFKGGQVAKNPESKRRTEQVIKKQTSSPFEQITLKKQSDEEQPVYRLEEPEYNYSKKYQNPNLLGYNEVNKANRQQNPFLQRNAFNQNNRTSNNYEQEAKKIKAEVQQSSTIQPQMISTKSVTKSVRRNKIFGDDNNSISNSSNIMNSRTIEGSFDKSRSKSKSKLGDLLKQSRQKKEQMANTIKQKDMANRPQKVVSPIQTKPSAVNSKNQRPQPIKNYESDMNTGKNIYERNTNLGYNQKSNLSYTIDSNSSLRLGGQKLAENHIKPQPIKRKSIQNQVFDLGQSQLQLNLSMSHKVPDKSGLKGDSVFFNFQPQKKKGISITSKQKSSAQNKSLQSKKHLDRLMKKCQQNQQFLAKSILSSNSQLRQSKKPNINPINSPVMIKKEETLNRPFQKMKQQKFEEQPAWHGLVKDEAAFQIKSVDRKQIRRPTQQLYKQNQPEQTKPISPAQFFKMQNQKNFQKNIKEKDQFQNMRMEKQQREKLKVQIEEKNKLLAQISKKSRDNQQKQPEKKSPVSSPNIPTVSDPKSLGYAFRQQEQQKYRKEENTKQRIRDQAQTSSLSHQLTFSQNGSERSNSQSAKKHKKKQTSLNIMKKHKVQVREQQPRAQQSFYEQPPQQPKINYQKQQQTKTKNEELSDRQFLPQASKTKVDYKKPNLINFMENEIEEERVKSKTDMNFYNYGGDALQKSIRPPSSKPPLSRKSNCSSSKSKSKAKQSTLNINPVKKQNKLLKNSQRNMQPQQNKKKKTLLDIAQDKQYQGSAYGGSDSQCSFNSRESFGSVNSKGSRRSSTSKKQSTLPITIKNKNNTLNNFRPSLNKISSTASQVQIFSHENQSIYNSLQEQSVRKSRQKPNIQQNQVRQQRTIVSKDTYFIDERGRLVKQDLIIKGNQIYGQSSNKTVEQMALQRMRRSRQHHRSRSKSRDGSRSRLSKKTSGSSFQQKGYESSSSSNYFKGGNNSNYNNSQYGNSQYGSSQYGNQKQNLYIQQFIKPVEQPSRSKQQNYKFQKPFNQRKIQNQFYENQEQYYESYYQEQDQYQEPVTKVTLNQLFGKPQNQSNKNPTPNYNQNPNQQNKRQQHLNTYNRQQYGPNSRYNQQEYGSNSRYNQQQYGLNSRFNGQESRQSARKKSLSRTQKTFYNK